MSANYAKQYATSSGLATRRSIYDFAVGQDLSVMIEEQLQPLDGMRFLDLGCGYGADVVRLAKTHRLSRAVGVDQSEGQIEDARTKATVDFVGAEFVVGDIGSISLDEQFDRILIRHVLHHTDDKRAVFANAVRHAAPGAKIIVALHSLRSLPHLESWCRWLGKNAGLTYESPKASCAVENADGLFVGFDERIVVEHTQTITLKSPEPYLAYLGTLHTWTPEPSDAQRTAFLEHAKEEMTRDIATHGTFKEPSVNGIIVITITQ